MPTPKKRRWIYSKKTKLTSKSAKMIVWPNKKLKKQKCESGCAAAVSINLHCSPLQYYTGEATATEALACVVFTFLPNKDCRKYETWKILQYYTSNIWNRSSCLYVLFSNSCQAAFAQTKIIENTKVWQSNPPILRRRQQQKPLLLLFSSSCQTSTVS